MANGKENNEDENTWDDFDSDRKFIPGIFEGSGMDRSPDRMSVPLKNSQIYPGANQSLQVGQYQGSVIGSSPIFADTGMYMPVGALEAQKAAAQEAESQRQQQLQQDRLDFEAPEAPTIEEDARFNFKLREKFDEMLNSYTQAAEQRHGPNAYTALKSDSTKIGRQFKSDLAKLDTIANVSDQTLGKVSEVLKDHRTEREKNYSPETLKLAKDIERLKGDFEDADPMDLIGKLGQFQESANLDALIQNTKVLDRVATSVTKEVSGMREDGRYDVAESTFVESAERHADIKAEELTRGDGRFSDYEKDRVKKHLLSGIKSQYKEDILRMRERDFNQDMGDAPSVEEVRVERDKNVLVGVRFEAEGVDETANVNWNVDYAVNVGSKESETFSGANVIAIPEGTQFNDDQEELIGPGKQEVAMNGRVKEFMRIGDKSVMRVEADVPVKKGDSQALKDIAELQKDIDNLKGGGGDAYGVDNEGEGGDVSEATKKRIKSKEKAIERIKRDYGFEKKDVYVDMKDHYSYQMQHRPNKTKAFIKSWLGGRTLKVNEEMVDVGALPSDQQTEFDATDLASQWGGWDQVADAVDSGELKIAE